MYDLGLLCASQLAGMGAAQMGGLRNAGGVFSDARQTAAQGRLRGGIDLGLGEFAPSTLSFKQEMQRDVNNWLEDWDKEEDKL